MSAYTEEKLEKYRGKRNLKYSGLKAHIGSRDIVEELKEEFPDLHEVVILNIIKSAGEAMFEEMAKEDYEDRPDEINMYYLGTLKKRHNKK